MRRLSTSTILIIALFLFPLTNATAESGTPAVAQTASELDHAPGEARPGSDETAQPETQDRGAPQLSREEICQMIETAAGKEELPVPFFARLIWRESRFNPQAVSPAGAQGIAQFMPRTANGRGLANPFDPLSALLESAEYLGELLRRFGNLGLAAAAYNAGPKRVQDWLERRGILRRETRDYVEIVTGHAPAAWTAGEPPHVEEDAENFRCAEIHKLARQRPSGSDGQSPAVTVNRMQVVLPAAAHLQARSTVAPAATTAKMAEHRRNIAEAKRKEADGKRKEASGSRKERAVASRGNARIALLSTRSRNRSNAPVRDSRSDSRSTAARGSSSRRQRVAANGHDAADRHCAPSKGGGRKACRSA